MRHDCAGDSSVTTLAKTTEGEKMSLEDQLGMLESDKVQLQLALRERGEQLDEAKRELAVVEAGRAIESKHTHVSTRTLVSVQDAQGMLLRRLSVNGDCAEGARLKLKDEDGKILALSEDLQEGTDPTSSSYLDELVGMRESDRHPAHVSTQVVRPNVSTASQSIPQLPCSSSNFDGDMEHRAGNRAGLLGETSDDLQERIAMLQDREKRMRLDYEQRQKHAVDRERNLLMRISKLEDDLQATRVQPKFGDAKRTIQIGLGAMMVANSLATHFYNQRQVAAQSVLQDCTNKTTAGPSAKGLGNSVPFKRPPVGPFRSEPHTPVNNATSGPHDSFSFSPTAGTEEKKRPWEDLEEEMKDPEFAKAFRFCLGNHTSSEGDDDDDEDDVIDGSEDDVISDSDYDEDKENEEYAKDMKYMEDWGKNMEIVAKKLVQTLRQAGPSHAEPNAALKWNVQNLEERALMWKKEEEKHREEYDKCDERLVIARFDLKDVESEMEITRQKQREENERFHQEMAAAQKEWTELQGNLTELRSELESEKQKVSSYQDMSKEMVALSKEVDEKQSLLADLEESRKSMLKALENFSWENAEVKCCDSNEKSFTQEETTDSTSIHCSDDEQSTSRQDDSKSTLPVPRKNKISKEECLHRLWEKESEIVKLKMEVRMLTAIAKNGCSKKLSEQQNKVDLMGEATVELHQIHVQSQQAIAKVTDCQKQMVSLEKQKNEIVKFIQAADEKRKDAQDKMETAQAGLKQTLEESESAESSVREAREELQAIEEKLDSETKEIEIKESELEKVQACLDATQNKYAEMEKKKLSYQHDMESALYESRKVEHDLQISRSELTSIGKQLEEKESRLKTANQELEISEMKRSALQSEITKLAEEKDSLHHSIKRQEEAMSVVLEEFNSQRASAEKDIKLQEANIDALAEEMEKKQQQLEAKTEELDNTTRKKEAVLEEVKAVKEDLEEAEKLLEKVNESRNQSQTEMLQFESQVNVYKEELKNLTEAKTSALRCGGIGTVGSPLALGSSSPLSLDFGDISQQVALAQQQALHQQQLNQQLREEQGYLIQVKNQAERQVESARMDLKSLKEQMDSVTAQLDRAKRDRDRMERSLDESKEETEHKERELKRLKEKLSDVKVQLNAAREEKEKVQEYVESLRERSTDFNCHHPQSANRSPSVRHVEDRTEILKLEKTIEETEITALRYKAKFEKAQQHAIQLEETLSFLKNSGTRSLQNPNEESSTEKIQLSIKKAENQLKMIQEEKCAAEEERNAARLEFHEISRKLSMLRKAALESDEEGDRLGAIRQELKSVKSQLLTAERERACAQQEAAQLNNQLHNAKEEASCRVQQADDRKDTALNQLRAVEEESRKAQQKIRQLEDEIDALKWKNNRLEKARVELEDEIRRGRAELEDKAQVIKCMEAERKLYLEELKTAQQQNMKQWEMKSDSMTDKTDLHIVNAKLLQELERVTKACKEWKGKDREKQRTLQKIKVEYETFTDAIQESNKLREEINSQKAKLEEKCLKLEKTIQGQNARIAFLKNEKNALEELVAVENLLNSNTKGKSRGAAGIMGSGKSPQQLHPDEIPILYEEIRLLGKLLGIPEGTSSPNPKSKFTRGAAGENSSMRSSTFKMRSTVVEMVSLVKKISETIRASRELKGGVLLQDHEEPSLVPSLHQLDCDHCVLVRSLSDLAKDLGGRAQSVITITQAAKKAAKTGGLDVSSVLGKILREARHMNDVCEGCIGEVAEEERKVCAALTALEANTRRVRGLEDRINRLVGTIVSLCDKLKGHNKPGQEMEGGEGSETSKAYKRRLERAMLLNRVKDAQIQRFENGDNNSMSEESSKNWSF